MSICLCLPACVRQLCYVNLRSKRAGLSCFIVIDYLWYCLLRLARLDDPIHKCHHSLLPAHRPAPHLDALTLSLLQNCPSYISPQHHSPECHNRSAEQSRSGFKNDNFCFTYPHRRAKAASPQSQLLPLGIRLIATSRSSTAIPRTMSHSSHLVVHVS